ncbi:hypothetical protein PENDEC_c006G05403 [Penicillium decumbens]|uniref:Zn(2)-C6 fungal-type domain-containing protein n=1 Tax=Penicillium decumbens TaxID=69771 RepID=A0A1V6PG90_PENDC|nr:hypothetical protein PENDEC_c006G05403 [Penicillium decumbens]
MPVATETMATTPNSQSAMDSAIADKKRNKLGYHRTSVACVHCRRRKIRCLVAADDPQGRCENCIRLRKDCQFFPVDQQPPMEKKSRPSSRLETASAGGSVTTPISPSPTNLNSESVDTFYQYPQVSLNSPGQDMSTFPPNTFAGNPMPGFVPDRSMGPGEFSGHPMESGVWNEFTTISDPQMLATMNASKNQMMNLSPNVWPSALPTSPMSATSPMTGQAHPMDPGATYAMQPDGTVWQVPPPPPGPPRAMSYPGQDMGSSFPNQFQPHMPPDLKRRMTTPAQTDSQNSSEPPEMQAYSGSYPTQAGMGFTQWPAMNTMSGMGVMQYPMYGDVPPQHFTNPPPMGHPGGPGRSGP